MLFRGVQKKTHRACDWKVEHVLYIPSGLACRHSIDVKFSSTIITATRKLCCQLLLHLLKRSFSFRSSLNLLFSLLFALLKAVDGLLLTLDSILWSHDKMWNDLFQNRLLVVDLLWLAICGKKKKRGETIIY